LEAEVRNILLILSASIFIFGCKKAETTTEADIEDTAQQIGDVMASVDESGGQSNGSVASLNNYNYQKTFDHLDQTTSSVASNFAQFFVMPAADAVTCYASGTAYGFGSCNSGSRTIVRSFNNCTIGTAVLSGDVTLTWAGSGAGCTLGGGSPVANDNVTRSPNFQLTGRRGATLTVSKTGSVGQKITYVSGTAPNMVFSFTNDGIRRQFKTSANAILLDQTTTVVSGTAITITGNARTNRVMNGGFLTVTNNITNVVCNFTPSNVTWNVATCNCPVQGSWSGSCSNSKSTTLTLTGCGTANYTEGNTTTSVTFDRCGG
jgi:hypothetical protein